ncbi:MAG: hypothetical protein WB615_13560 [Candidatus Tumulicola sp.]
MTPYDGSMTPDGSLRGPNEVVIWGASGLLALLLGLGGAFVAWFALHRTAETVMAQGAVGSLSLGIVLVGLGAQRPLTRVFLVLLAATLVLGYALGGPQFARLVP